MKNFKFYALILLLAATVSCNKNDSGSANLNIKGNVSSDDAADMVAASISSSDAASVAGVSSDVSVSAQAFVNIHLGCGAVKSDSISRSYTGSQVSYSYKLKYNYTLNCSNNVPDNLSSDVSYSGSYSGPRLSMTNSGSSSFVVGGLAPTSTNFVINGQYKRSGSFKSKVDTAKNGSSDINITVKSLTLIRPSRKIASGSAAFTIAGNVPKKGDFAFTGDIVFNGDGTAKVTINGTVYIVNMETGEKTKK